MSNRIHKTCTAKLIDSIMLLAVCIPVTVSAADNTVRTPASGAKAKGSTIERGRYLVQVAGCNDCHTAGYAQAEGKLPEKEWLLGDRLGFRGPWGTTYPANLRLTMSNMSESEWIKSAQTRKLRPPMPWFALRDMDKEDVRAIYRYVRHLGPGGVPAPAFVPPNQTPSGPYVQFPGPPH
ncbi:c-type cytochrome [Massilia sp. LXY-6]|uniref:c-type cytochrome n=1 Tax=Massilia sp. LXY-6 TaxID=3379823 RepID=UPI003EE2BC58